MQDKYLHDGWNKCSDSISCSVSNAILARSRNFGEGEDKSLRGNLAFDVESVTIFLEWVRLSWSDGKAYILCWKPLWAAAGRGDLSSCICSSPPGEREKPRSDPRVFGAPGGAASSVNSRLKWFTVCWSGFSLDSKGMASSLNSVQASVSSVNSKSTDFRYRCGGITSFIA